MSILKGIGVGAGYFSHFQYESWKRNGEVEIAAICNRSVDKATLIAERYGIEKVSPWSDLETLLDEIKPDFIDIITPPETHLEVTQLAASKGINVICQKPLAPTLEESRQIVKLAKNAGIRFMVHENWRWQPWYREIKRQLDRGILGQLHSISVRMRMGDGWQEDAYLARQPFFRDYPRLLVYETGVHFLDTFRFLGGEVSTVYARLQKRNPGIQGEDSGQIIVGFENGATAILDASRYNETDCRDPRVYLWNRSHRWEQRSYGIGRGRSACAEASGPANGVDRLPASTEGLRGRLRPPPATALRGLYPQRDALRKHRG